MTKEDFESCGKTCGLVKRLEKGNTLLGERCNQLLKDKGELTDQIDDIKANCDLAIEGRDIKIDELEKENARLNRLSDMQDETVVDLTNNPLPDFDVDLGGFRSI